MHSSKPRAMQEDAFPKVISLLAHQFPRQCQYYRCSTLQSQLPEVALPHQPTLLISDP